MTIDSTGAVTMSSTLSVGGTTINGGIELFYDTPYIDFHFGKSSADYTSRIIEDEAGKIRLVGELRVNGQTTLYNNLVVEGDGSFAAGLNCLDFAVRKNAYIPNIEWQKIYGLRPNTNADALIGFFDNAPILLSQSGTLRLGRYGFDSNYWCQFTFNSSTKVLTIAPADNFAFTTTISGNLVVAGDTSSGSDIRFKDKLSDHRIALSDIAEAPLFTFKWNDREDDSVHLGSSAQYWEKVAPWLVKGEDFKTLDYSTLGVAIGISLANKAVNHEERIKILENENKALKEEIRRIQYGS
jgi:hypothetical protein